MFRCRSQRFFYECFGFFDLREDLFLEHNHNGRTSVALLLMDQVERSFCFFWCAYTLKRLDTFCPKELFKEREKRFIGKQTTAEHVAQFRGFDVWSKHGEGEGALGALPTP